MLAPDPFKEHVQDKKRRWLNWPLLSPPDPQLNPPVSDSNYLKIFHFDYREAGVSIYWTLMNTCLCLDQFHDLSLTRASPERVTSVIIVCYYSPISVI